MSKSKEIENNEGLSQARQHFDIGHSLFLVRYSFFNYKNTQITLFSAQNCKNKSLDRPPESS